MSTSTLTSKGQITIPKAVRQALGLEAGTQVVFVLEDQRALLYPVKPGALERLRQVVQHSTMPPDRAAERAAAREAAIAHALGDVASGAG